MIFETDLEPSYCLEKSGYKLLKENEYVLPVGENRFHAKIVGDKKIDLHFDKTHFDPLSKRTYHSSAPKYQVNEEKKRIRKNT